MIDDGLRFDDLIEGTVLDGRYRIQLPLGRGGMGVVYRGEHLTVGRPVAIKVLAAEWSEHEDVSRRFRAEARAASAAGHPNIIEVLDAGELPDGRPYLVTELLDGRELYDVLRSQGVLDAEQTCRIGISIARALEAAHGQGIVHRDLKLENVMLVRHGEEEVVKVLDFGIAADTADPGRRRTAVGKVLGTPDTMAPEQAAGGKATPAFDIYAFGVLAFEMLVGHGPFKGESAHGLMLAKMDADAPSVASVREGLPAALVELVDQCLARDPSQRPSSAREVAHRLQEILRSLESPVTLVSSEGPRFTHTLLAATVPTTRPRRGGGWVIWAGAAMLVLGLGLGLGAWSVASTPDPPAAVPATASAAEGPAAAVPGLPLVETTPEVGTEPPVALEREDGAGLADAVEPAVEAGPAVEPLPAIEVEAPPPERTRAPRATTPKSDEDGESDEPTSTPADCTRTRKQARQARQDSDWSGIVRHTARRECWRDAKSDRRRLRTKAFMELGRWDECVASGKGLVGSEPEAWVRLCERRRDRG